MGEEQVTYETAAKFFVIMILVMCWIAQIRVDLDTQLVGQMVYLSAIFTTLIALVKYFEETNDYSV